MLKQEIDLQKLRVGRSRRTEQIIGSGNMRDDTKSTPRRQGLFYALLALICIFLIATVLRPFQESRSSDAEGPWRMLSSAAQARRAASHRHGGAKDKFILLTVAHLTAQVNRPELPYADKMRDDRTAYCARNGCEFVLRDVSDFVAKPVGGGNPGASADAWAKLPALREALEEYRDKAEWIWLLEPEAVIMDHGVNLVDAMLKESRLESLMLRDASIVPPESVIRTVRTATASDVSFVINHDGAGISTQSFVLRNDDYARYLLEYWNEPLYRSYNFDRQEQSALEHIVQWHYTILARTALLPKKSLASFGEVAPQQDVAYEDGDFVVALAGCANTLGRSCDREFDRYYAKRQNVLKPQDTDGPTEAQQAHLAAAADKIMNEAQ